MIAAGSWTRVESIFHDAVGVPASSREVFVRSRCGSDEDVRNGVMFLLRGSDLAGPEFIEPPGEHGGNGRRGEATRIGRYTIIRALASGGMGEVYEAEQDVPRRRVALKVLRSGLASAAMVRRFEHESELLGRLRHPGIAQVYDAGTQDDGFGPSPYFAMELVPEASTITAYAAAHGLDVRGRLELFALVCDAVQHGHQQGVIHRDLKPANILIDAAGAPKVIDFGVARALDSAAVGTMATGAGQLIGTVPYMSPEQLGSDPGDVDTRSDVFALGVVLYELLCGRLPHEVEGVSIAEAARVIREAAPARPSTVVRGLRGDLETIVLCALEKDRARRYQSVAELAADLRRFLRDEPIGAHLATTLYQLRKLARRHRGAAAGAAVALIGLVLGLGGATWQAVRATGQRDRAVLAEARAKGEADTARRIAKCLESAIAAVDPMQNSASSRSSVSDGSAASPVAVLNASAETILRELKDRPLEQADLLDRLGAVYLGLGLAGRARSVLESALAIREREWGGNDPRLGEMLNRLGAAVFALGDGAQAANVLRRAIRTIPPGGPLSAERSQAGSTLVTVLCARHEYEEAEAVIRRAIIDAEEARCYDFVRSARSVLAGVLCDRGDLAGARSECAVALGSAMVAGDVAQAARLQVTLGTIEERQGDIAAAEQIYAEGQATWSRHPVENTLVNAHTAIQIANLFRSRNRYGQAAVFSRDALDRFRAILGARHMLVAEVDRQVAGDLLEDGRDLEAAPFFREALLAYRLVVGDEHLEVGTCLFRLAQIAASHADAAGLRRIRPEAEDFVRVSRSLPESHPHRSGALLLMGVIDTGLGDAAGAEPALRECVRLRVAQLGPEHRLTAYAQTVLGTCLSRLGNFEEAEGLLLAGVPRVAAGYRPGSFVTAEARGRVVEMYEAWGKGAEADRYRRGEAAGAAR